MSLYEEFRFRPAEWLPQSDLPLEELERVRNIPREDMEYTNENGFSVKVVIDPTLHMVQDMFYRILMSDLNDTPFSMICRLILICVRLESTLITRLARRISRAVATRAGA